MSKEKQQAILLKHKTTIIELRNKINKQQAALTKYYRYYKGEHDILNSYRETKGSNVKEVHNYCKLFINNNTGFLLGNPVQLKAQDSEDIDIDDKNLVDVYNEQIGTYIQQVDQKLMQYQQTFGYAFELNYINKYGEFAVDVVSPLKMAVNRKGNKVTHGLLFQHSETTESGDKRDFYDYFDVLDGTIVRVAIQEDKVYAVDSPIKNKIKNPIIVVQNNHESQSEMEDIMSLNDAYNQVSSDLTNEISDHRNSYFHITGAKITEEVLRKMQESGVITSPEQAKLGFLTKDINDAFVQNKLNQLHTQIYNMAGQVDFNDTNIGSNTSSLALRNKLTTLINHLKLKEGFLREAILIRLRNLAEYMELTKVGESYDYTQIGVEFTPNIPTSDFEVAKMIIELYDAKLISRETAIDELPFVNNTRNEIRRIDEESEKYDNISNLFGESIRQMSELNE